MKYPKLRPAVKKEWLKSLRSGEYTQGHMRLAINRRGSQHDKFCCLGVLCDMAVLKGKARWVDSLPAAEGTVTGSCQPLRDGHYAFGSTTSLPGEITGWAFPAYTKGREDNTRTVESATNKLMDMNDSGKSFAEIAKWISRYL